jgi:hypothetical protein
VNIAAALAGTFCSTCPHNIANVFAAVFYAALAIPLSFRLWYFTLYNGFKYASERYIPGLQA